MAFDHYRASGCKGGCGVAARSREGRLDVQGTEDYARVDQALDCFQIGPWQVRAFRKRGVVASVRIIALPDVIGEQT